MVIQILQLEENVMLHPIHWYSGEWKSNGSEGLKRIFAIKKICYKPQPLTLKIRGNKTWPLCMNQQFVFISQSIMRITLTLRITSISSCHVAWQQCTVFLVRDWTPYHCLCRNSLQCGLSAAFPLHDTSQHEFVRGFKNFKGYVMLRHTKLSCGIKLKQIL